MPVTRIPHVLLSSATFSAITNFSKKDILLYPFQRSFPIDHICCFSFSAVSVYLLLRRATSLQILKRIHRRAVFSHCEIKVRAFHRIIFGRCTDISDHFAFFYRVTFCHCKILQLSVHRLIAISKLHGHSRSCAGILCNDHLPPHTLVHLPLPAEK